MILNRNNERKKKRVFIHKKKRQRKKKGDLHIDYNLVGSLNTVASADTSSIARIENDDGCLCKRPICYKILIFRISMSFHCNTVN